MVALCQLRTSEPRCIIYGLFTRTVSVSVSATVSVYVYHCINGNGPFDGQNGLGTHSNCQTDRHYTYNVNLTDTVTDTDTETVTGGTYNQALMPPKYYSEKQYLKVTVTTLCERVADYGKHLLIAALFSLADLKGAPGTPPRGQILSISCSFWGKKMAK